MPINPAPAFGLGMVAYDQKFVTRPNPWYFPLATSDTTRLPGIFSSLVKKDPHPGGYEIFVPGGQRRKRFFDINTGVYAKQRM
jgi:hypothetical protein